MIEEIKNVIEKIYITGDYSFFISKCHQRINFFDEFLDNLRNRCEKIELRNDSGTPSADVYFYQNSFSKGNFKVTYNSVLHISKIYDVFYLQHEFAVDNLDPNKMDLVLDGFGDQAYTKQQYDIDNIISEFLQKKNYKRLKYAEIEEVLPSIDMPPNCIFGSQMTIENALFKDIWNICPETNN